jgi:hypothetical protein
LQKETMSLVMEMQMVTLLVEMARGRRWAVEEELGAVDDGYAET